jgi:hypothetical protein
MALLRNVLVLSLVSQGKSSSITFFISTHLVPSISPNPYACGSQSKARRADSSRFRPVLSFGTDFLHPDRPRYTHLFRFWIRISDTDGTCGDGPFPTGVLG